MTMRGRRGASLRRQRVWANQRLNSTQLTSGQDGIGEIVGASWLTSNFETDIGAIPIGSTIGRVLGTINLRASAETTPVPGTSGIVSLGIGVIDRDQVNVPDPVEDHFDWLWQVEVTVSVRSDQPASFSYPYFPEAAALLPVDIRAMRKFRENHNKLVLIASHNGMTTHRPQITAYFRTLLLLP